MDYPQIWDGAVCTVINDACLCYDIYAHTACMRIVKEWYQDEAYTNLSLDKHRIDHIHQGGSNVHIQIVTVSSL